jgi:hypothetical protein
VRLLRCGGVRCANICVWHGNASAILGYMEPDNQANNSTETTEMETSISPLKKYRYVIFGLIGVLILVLLGLLYLQISRGDHSDKLNSFVSNQNTTDDSGSKSGEKYIVASGERNLVQAGVLQNGYAGYRGASVVGGVSESEFEILPLHNAETADFISSDNYVTVSTDSNTVYHLHVVESNSGLIRLTKLEKSDARSFEFLSGGYAKDKNNVYFESSIISDVKSSDFTTISGLLSSQDEQYEIIYSEIIIGFDGELYFYRDVGISDVRKFKLFSDTSYFSSDDKVYYIDNEIIGKPAVTIAVDGIDPNAFHVKSLQIDELGTEATFGFSFETIIYEDEVLNLNARRINCYENNTVLNHLSKNYRLERTHPLAAPKIGLTSYVDASGESDCEWTHASRSFLDISRRSMITQDEYKFEVFNRPQGAPGGDQFNVIYGGNRYVMQSELDFDIGYTPTSSLFVTGVDIWEDGVPDVGVMSSENPIEYTFWALNEKHDIVEHGGLPSLKKQEVEYLLNRDLNGFVVIEQYDFIFNDQDGTVKHKCLPDENGKYLIRPKGYMGSGGHCAQNGVLEVTFNSETKIIEEYEIQEEQDYKSVGLYGFTQTEFASKHNIYTKDDPYVVSKVQQSADPADKLLIGFYHNSCLWQTNPACISNKVVTHYVSLPSLRINQFTKPVSAILGLKSMKWNNDRSAFVMRSATFDIQPSFAGYVLDEPDPRFTYDGGITLPLNGDLWTEEDKAFAERIWENDEVEWLNDNQVRILDVGFEINTGEQITI